MSITWETPSWAERKQPETQTHRFREMGVPALGAIAGAAAVAGLVFMFYHPAPRPVVPAEQPAAEQPAAERAMPESVAPVQASILPAGPAELPAGSARFTVARPASASADSPVPFAAPAAEKIDPAGTASLVPVAETEQQVAALESELAAEGASGFAAPAADAAPVAVEVAVAEPGMAPARTTKWVNMRASPDNDAEVIEVVPYDAEIMAEQNCPSWCSVVHEGKQGYIYKDFLARPDGQSQG